MQYSIHIVKSAVRGPGYELERVRVRVRVMKCFR